MYRLVCVFVLFGALIYEFRTEKIDFPNETDMQLCRRISGVGNESISYHEERVDQLNRSTCFIACISRGRNDSMWDVNGSMNPKIFAHVTADMNETGLSASDNWLRSLEKCSKIKRRDFCRAAIALTRCLVINVFPR